MSTSRSSETVRAGALYEGEEFEQVLLGDATLEGCRFVDCTFRSSSFGPERADRSSWRGSRLGSVRFTGTAMPRSTWLDTTLSGCALSGCELYGAQLRRVRFEGCLLDSVNLRDAVLREVVFDDCTVRHLDLGSARLTDVTLRGSTVERLDLTAANLSRVDLRGSRLEVSRGFDRLTGVTIDPSQLLDLAPALAAHLGLTVQALD